MPIDGNIKGNDVMCCGNQHLYKDKGLPAPKARILLLESELEFD